VSIELQDEDSKDEQELQNNSRTALESFTDVIVAMLGVPGFFILLLISVAFFGGFGFLVAVLIAYFVFKSFKSDDSKKHGTGNAPQGFFRWGMLIRIPVVLLTGFFAFGFLAMVFRPP
jgi:hypothetical protein